MKLVSNLIRERWLANFGDAELIRRAFRTEFFKDLLTKDKLMVWNLVKRFVQMNTAMFINMPGMILRYKHGQRTTGYILYGCTLITLLVYNSSAVIHFLKPVGWMITPFLPFFYEPEVIWGWIVTDIHSSALLGYTGLYAIGGFIHSAMITLGFGNMDLTKRGESYLYQFVFKPLGIHNEFIVQGVIEPILLALLSWYFFSWQQDVVMGFMLAVSGICLFLVEVADYAEGQNAQVSFEDP